MSITIAIPTKNRYEKVKRLLTCLSFQTVKDFSVIIADASDISTNYGDLFKDLLIDVFPVKNGNLPRQRRMLIEKCSTEYIGFLDDDVTVDNNFIKDVLLITESNRHRSLAGLSGYIKHVPVPKRSIKKTIRRVISGVFLGSPGALTLAGVAVPISKRPESEIEVEYLQGPCMILKLDYISTTEITDLYEMYERKQGRAEDIALSSLARRSGQLKVVPSITVTHNMEGGGSPIAKKGFNKGIADTYGRFYVAVFSGRDNHPLLRKLAFFWYCFITTIILSPAFINDSGYRSGVLQGLKLCLRLNSRMMQ